MRAEIHCLHRRGTLMLEGYIGVIPRIGEHVIVNGTLYLVKDLVYEITNTPGSPAVMTTPLKIYLEEQ